jgi:cell division transport system permease protein
MSGSSNRPLRPSLQRALMQQRQRTQEPLFDDRINPTGGQDTPSGGYARATPAHDYDPYGYDQYPDEFKTGEAAPDTYGQPYADPRTASNAPRSTPPTGFGDPATSGYAEAPPATEPSPAALRTLSHPEQLTADLAPPSRPVVSQRSGPSTTATSLDRGPPPPSLSAEAVAPEEMYAPSRRRGARSGQSSAPIVPPGSVTGKSLTLVISIMCFLACLTAGAVYMMNQSAAAWLRDIASEVTVQIEAKDRTDPEKQMRDVSQYLARQPGVRNVRPLSVADSAQLLEPWLGQSDALKSLPIPRLIALEVDRLQPPDLVQMRTQLAAQFKGVSLDDHRHWQQQIRTVTRSFALGGLAILMLVGAATTAIIVSATRSALASNREIVEVLHFVGATDKFIAREFEKHFLRLGIRAGLVGALSAMAVFLGLPFVMELLGGGTVTMAELRRMIGTGTLDLPGYVLLGIVVVVISALCMLTSRIGVYRILHTQR